MATYSRRERIEKTIEFIVPTPATWVEVDKAATAAWREFQEVYGRTPADDEMMACVGDDEVIIRFALMEHQEATLAPVWGKP